MTNFCSQGSILATATFAVKQFTEEENMQLERREILTFCSLFAINVSTARFMFSNSATTIKTTVYIIFVN